MPVTRQQLAVGVVLAGLVVLGAWLRFQFIVCYGGLEPSYLEWANKNYFGGITASYLSGARFLRALVPYPSIAYPPGYATFLASLQSIGFADLQRLRYAQAALESLVVALVYVLARDLGIGRIWSLAAAGFYSVYTPLAIGAGLIMAEALSPGLMVLSLWATIWASREPSVRRLALLGGLLSAIAMIRPDFLLLPGLLGAWLWLFGGVPRRAVLLAAFAGAFVFVMLPWGLHNRLTHGSWVFTSTGGAMGLWEGLGEIPNPYGYRLGDAETMAMLRAKGFRMHSPEADRYLRTDYMRAWREHPGFVLQVIASRWDSILTESERLDPPAFRRLEIALNTWGVYVWGLAILVGARRRVTWLVLAVPVLYALLSIGLVHYEPRYVRYVQVFYVIAALSLVSRLFEVEWRRPYVTAAATAVAVVVIGLAVVGAAGEVGIVRSRANGLVAEKALADPAEFAKLRLVSGGELEWQVDTIATAAREDSRLHVSSNAAGSSYLLARNVDVPETNLVVLSYDLVLNEGAVTVGILDSKGHWLKTVNLITPGAHQGTLVAEWPGGNRATLVIAGANPQPVKTSFDVGNTELRIR